MGRGAWRATVHRVSKSQTRLKLLSTHCVQEFPGGPVGRTPCFHCWSLFEEQRSPKLHGTVRKEKKSGRLCPMHKAGNGSYWWLDIHSVSFYCVCQALCWALGTAMVPMMGELTYWSKDMHYYLVTKLQFEECSRVEKLSPWRVNNGLGIWSWGKQGSREERSRWREGTGRRRSVEEFEWLSG